MTTFTYKATNREGQSQSGQIDAISSFAAGKQLKQQGLVLTDIQEQGKNFDIMAYFSQFGKVPLKEKIVFIQDLDLLLKSGVAAPRALRIISKQTSNKKFKGIVDQLAKDVEEGKSLHESMGAYPQVFSHIFISMIEVGEISGNLEKSLEYLRIQLQREADLRSKTKGAMIYPAVIVSAMVIIGVLMAIFVLPKLTDTFKDFDAELPILTRITITIADFMAANAVLVIVGMIAVIVGAIMFMRTAQGKRLMSLALLNMPMIKQIAKKINIARFSRILGSLIKSGVSVVQGLKVTGESLDNVFYREAILETAKNVQTGKPLTESLQKYEKLFPFIITQMLSIGEETGNLEKILDQIAAQYEMEIDDTMKNLSSIIEPILLLVIGVVVGFLALALIMPIYNISQGI